MYPSDDFANVSEPTIQTVIYNCGKSEFSNKDKEKLNLHIDNDHKPNTTHDTTRIEKDVSIEGIQDLDDALKNCTLCNYKTTAHDGLKVLWKQSILKQPGNKEISLQVLSAVRFSVLNKPLRNTN